MVEEKPSFMEYVEGGIDLGVAKPTKKPKPNPWSRLMIKLSALGDWISKPSNDNTVTLKAKPTDNVLEDKDMHGGTFDYAALDSGSSDNTHPYTTGAPYVPIDSKQMERDILSSLNSGKRNKRR